MRTKIPARLGVLVTAAMLAGCATYHALPLENGRGPRSVADLTVSAASMPIPALRTYTFNPANGLNVTEVAMLAVANNPKLKDQRDALGLAQAQAYQAGLLPDPQVSYEHDRPVGQNPPGTTTAITEGLSYNFGDLITRSARVKAARAGVRQVNLDLLWSEWQVIAQARTLFDQVYFLHEQVARLEDEQRALAPVQKAIRHALQSGNLSFDTATAGLNAVSDVTTQLATTQRQLNLAEHDLHELLGVDLSVPLHLTGAPFSVDPSAGEVQDALADMPKRRPDLLALQAGYRSQDETLRAAILAQFPAITIGFIKARDNSDVHSLGLSAGISLPLFDGNRGQIAIERATRQQLRDAYSERLLTDRNDVQQLFADLKSDRAQRRKLAAHVAQLSQLLHAAQANYAAGRLVWPTYLAIRSNALAAYTTLLTLEQDTHTTAIALDALVGNWPNAAAVAGTPSHSSHPSHAGITHTRASAQRYTGTREESQS